MGMSYWVRNASAIGKMSELPDNSPFRMPGTRFTFILPDSIGSDAELAWGAINDPTVIQNPVP